MKLLEKQNLQKLTTRLEVTLEWLQHNISHPEFFTKAREYAILTVKIHNFIKLNKPYKKRL